jgi:hypothetical protein
MKKLEDGANTICYDVLKYEGLGIKWQASFKLGLESILPHLTGDGFYRALCDNATAL